MFFNAGNWMDEQVAYTTTEALLKSILAGPLLLGDLPESKSFCRSKLELPATIPNLNLQQKLGHLFEDALASMIAASDRVELLEQNLQLRDEELKTVGELDFLLKAHSTPTLIHLELATKFYLAVDTPNGITLPGPDARDNYYRKLARMRDHQLQLPDKFRSCLPPEYEHIPIETQQLVYGCLFAHVDTLEAFTPEFVPLEFLDDIDLEPWNPKEPIDRCLMIRTVNAPTPFFIAPVGYPNQA